jgi:hypothetical protein
MKNNSYETPRTKSIQLRGEDVKLLQSELRQISFSIPDEEMQRSFLDEQTRAAVLELPGVAATQPDGAHWRGCRGSR